MCVCLGCEDHRESGNKCEKVKGEEGERRLSASVMCMWLRVGVGMGVYKQE